MRKKLVAGNWKMYKSAGEARDMVAALLPLLSGDADVVLCPPYLALPATVEACAGTKVGVAGQDAFWLDEGAYTSQVSAAMLKAAGATHCVLGHSETRGRFGSADLPASQVAAFAETDETVNLKARACLRHGLVPIVCVGETEAEREEGRTDAVVQGQVARALQDIEPTDVARMVLAYEPVWAIGTGKTCGPDEANRVCGVVRKAVARAAGDAAPGACRVLYGGSVKPDNAGALFSQTEIDGGLVGGASLDAQTFARIIAAA
ncbi:MAG: triose-phosphate isomerase [Fimbriimonadaceae bacterium]|nr:triose-phosphate isomerase [Fimbriimonadaceae bacterium]QYK55653.1 MAG: triose-phosphate isomerase [Fimbriimonadaceae bacterium]